MAPASVRFFKSDSLDNACPREPRTFCHQDSFLVLCASTCISPPGLMPDGAWVSFKDSEKVRTHHRLPSHWQALYPWRDLEHTSCCMGDSPQCCLQLRCREAWPQLFFSYGANFSLSGQLGTVLGRSFSLRLPSNWQSSCLDILSAGIISMLHSPGQCFSDYGRVNPGIPPDVSSQPSICPHSSHLVDDKETAGVRAWGPLSALTVSGSAQGSGCPAIA